MKTNIKILMSLLTILNLSCENLSDPGEIEIKNSVFINLIINGRQKFYIYNTVDFETTTRDDFLLYSFDKYFVDGAVISLSDSTSTYNDFIIEKDSLNTRYYTLTGNNNFKTDTKYTLSINSNGQNINGSTITPGDFNLISPVDNQIVHPTGNKFSIGIKWSKSNNAKGYLVNVSYPFYYEPLNYHDKYTAEEIIFDDTSYTYSHFLIPTDSVSITVMAFDENYYNHVFEGKNSSGIKGAYGYFGSSVLQTRKVWVE